MDSENSCTQYVQKTSEIHLHCMTFQELLRDIGRCQAQLWNFDSKTSSECSSAPKLPKYFAAHQNPTREIIFIMLIIMMTIVLSILSITFITGASISGCQPNTYTHTKHQKIPPSHLRLVPAILGPIWWPRTSRVKLVLKQWRFGRSFSFLNG